MLQCSGYAQWAKYNKKQFVSYYVYSIHSITYTVNLFIHKKTPRMSEKLGVLVLYMGI